MAVPEWLSQFLKKIDFPPPANPPVVLSAETLLAIPVQRSRHHGEVADQQVVDGGSYGYPELANRDYWESLPGYDPNGGRVAAAPPDAKGRAPHSQQERDAAKLEAIVRRMEQHGITPVFERQPQFDRPAGDIIGPEALDPDSLSGPDSLAL